MYRKIACMQSVKRFTVIQYGLNRMLIVKVYLFVLCYDEKCYLI